jgi:AcrR family transcriptional regulator
MARRCETMPSKIAPLGGPTRFSGAADNGLRPSGICAPGVKVEFALPLASFLTPITEGGSANPTGVGKSGGAPATMRIHYIGPWRGMKKRRYVSSARAASAAETKKGVIDAARRLLSEEGDFGAFSLESVARAAGVSRLTVYNQFGSRRGLLEAVFDDLAERGGLGRIPQAMTLSDPRKALENLIEIFCGFWASDPAVGKLNEAAAIEPEFGEAVRDRNERRRRALGAVIERIVAGNKMLPQQRRDAIDLIFGFTSYSMFKALAANRKADAVCILIKASCAALLDALLADR